MLTKLANDPCNVVYIVSGRSKQNLQDWFGHINNLGLAAEHGYYIRQPTKWHRERAAILRRKEVESHLSLDATAAEISALYLEDAEISRQVLQTNTSCCAINSWFAQKNGRVVLMPRSRSADSIPSLGRPIPRAAQVPLGSIRTLPPIQDHEAWPMALPRIDSRQASAEHDGESPLHYVHGTDTDESPDDIVESEWEMKFPNLDLSWKAEVLSMLQDVTTRTPGSFIEAKDCSITWHFRDCDPDFGLTQAKSLQLHFDHILQHSPVKVVSAIQKRYLIIVPRRLSKGRAVQHILAEHDLAGDRFDLIIAFGDERTDEDMFDVLQGNYCFTCTVGRKTTRATHFVDSADDVCIALQALNQVCLRSSTTTTTTTTTTVRLMILIFRWETIRTA